jgi:hypothetical protein
MSENVNRGFLVAGGTVVVPFTCEAFQLGQENTNNDRITVEYA